MIQSEFGGDGTTLHLYLIGSLNARAADALCDEYRQRRVPALRECIVDLTGVDELDEEGLRTLRSLLRATQARHVKLVLQCTGSAHAAALRTEAKRLGIQLRSPVELT